MPPPARRLPGLGLPGQPVEAALLVLEDQRARLEARGHEADVGRALRGRLRDGQRRIERAYRIDIAVSDGVLDKNGAYYSFAGKSIGQGREKTREALKQNAELRKKIHNAIRAAEAKTEQSSAMAA